MIKISIEDDLKSQKRAAKKNLDGNEMITQIKLLTDKDASEDLRIANGLGSKHTISLAGEDLGKRIELEKLDDKYLGDVYTIDQIKKLALDYNLRFLSTRHFKGNLDVDVIFKIKEFAKATSTDLSDYYLKNKFFILAPPNQFDLKDGPIKSSSTGDPAIFYMINDTHYRLIHKWGVDFTIFRLLSGFKRTNPFTWILFNTFLTLPIVAILTSFFSPSFSHFFFGFFISFLVNALIFGVAYGDGDEKNIYTKDVWDTNYK